MAYEENNVDWYGLDKRKWDNRNKISDLSIGDEVWVLDLGNYKAQVRPKLPAKAKVVKIYEHEIDVEIYGCGREYPWEIYESQFGIKKTPDWPFKLI